MKKFLMILSLLSVPLIFQWDIYQVLKLRTFDALVAQGEPSGYFTVLNITEEDIDREGGYPLPRYRLAEIQHDLLEHGAIDMIVDRRNMKSEITNIIKTLINNPADKADLAIN